MMITLLKTEFWIYSWAFISTEDIHFSILGKYSFGVCLLAAIDQPNLIVSPRAVLTILQFY